jgi:hypothetical protein
MAKYMEINLFSRLAENRLRVDECLFGMAGDFSETVKCLLVDLSIFSGLHVGKQQLLERGDKDPGKDVKLQFT